MAAEPTMGFGDRSVAVHNMSFDMSLAQFHEITVRHGEVVLAYLEVAPNGLPRGYG